MVRDRRFLALIALALVAGTFATGQRRQEMRRSQIYGLQGPIHTQLSISKKLNDDPRENGRLFMRHQEGWLEFAPDGEIMEHGSVDNSGKITTVVREGHDAEGKARESVVMEGDKTTHTRIETSATNDGQQETKTFVNGKLLSQSTGSFNPQTGRGETSTFNEKGELTHHGISTNNPLRQEAEVYAQDGKFLLHSLRRLDNKGELIESLRYDAEGKVISDLVFKDGVLTSWWQDPKCGCTNNAGFHRPGGMTVFYATTKEGKLLKTVQHHNDRPTNHDIDDEELYDENNRLLERIAYSHERDEHGNWTKRTVSVLDSKTGNMVPVREDTRQLTYY